MISVASAGPFKSAKLAAAFAMALAGVAWPVCAAMNQTAAAGPGRVVSMTGARPEPTAASATVAVPDSDAHYADVVPDPFRAFDPESVPTGSVPPLAADVPKSGISGPLAPVLPPATSIPVTIPVMKASAAPSATPTLRLTGVVVGDRPTAVVSLGEGEIVVRPGERLPDGSTLMRIDRASATFVRQGRKSTLWIAE